MRYLDGIKHLTPTEAAKLLGVSRALVLQAIRCGQLRAHWHRYRLYLPVVEVERYLDEHLNRSVDRVAAKMLAAMGLRIRLILSWTNGHGRDSGRQP